MRFYVRIVIVFFKMRISGIFKIQHQCKLEVKEAARFFEKYGVTTCEVGMGEVMVSDSKTENDKIIRKLKIRGIV